jgi:hypothetical protein
MKKVSSMMNGPVVKDYQKKKYISQNKEMEYLNLVVLTVICTLVFMFMIKQAISYGELSVNTKANISRIQNESIKRDLRDFNLKDSQNTRW